jgi:hypothetical protein
MVIRGRNTSLSVDMVRVVGILGRWGNIGRERWFAGA